VQTRPFRSDQAKLFENTLVVVPVICSNIYSWNGDADYEIEEFLKYSFELIGDLFD
jgi:hypothetical protein